MLKIEIIQSDITRIPADGIVNAANDMLRIGGGVDGAIHRAGGAGLRDDFLRVRAQVGGCPVGEVVVTVAGDLPGRYVLHAVGPVWEGGDKDEALLLYKTYFNALRLAGELGLQSVSFPNISTGVFRFPKAEAASIAYQAVLDYGFMHDSSIERVLFVCFDGENVVLYQSMENKYPSMSMLGRYILAQEACFDMAFREIESGQKCSHWMWFIFPQLMGLGSSYNAQYYGIKDLEEAKAYLMHPILGTRLLSICEALLKVSGKTALDIMGSPDDIKLQSCLTLFSQIVGYSSVFELLLSRYFEGNRCLRSIIN
jgi:O-acetyl-ADP-ribose deacetylase